MGGKRPEDMSPQEIHAVLWQVLSFRDSIAKKIEGTIEKIPGLGPLIEKISDSIQGASFEFDLVLYCAFVDDWSSSVRVHDA